MDKQIWFSILLVCPFSAIGTKFFSSAVQFTFGYTPITYYWTNLLILDHSYLVGNLTSSQIAETNTSEPLKP
jgi:hypothetical protein